ncbi:MAG TPA: GtrA family protein [Bacteroidales bacterium]|nr:GtrA family protein [Bacteroidales bacterium]
MIERIDKTSILSMIKSETFTQAAKYFVVGGICTVLDVSLLFVLSKYFGLNYIVASIISFLVGTVLNYFLCTFWIFRVHKVENRYYEFGYYLLITIFGLALNTFIIWGVTELFDVNYMYSKLVAIFATFFWNFCARKYFLHTIK